MKPGNPTIAPTRGTGRAAGLATASLGLALASLLTGGLEAQEPFDPSPILSQYGIRPVSPPSQASDFTLPTLEGASVSLSSYAGNWVILTFFATWCGPCVSEMPTMQQLFEVMGEAGLTVVGVSIDSELSPVLAFRDRLGLRFPLLWDGSGAAARVYRADSIPLSYLIDPLGRIVGVSRGARDWSALSGLMDSLMAASPPHAGAPSQYSAGGGVVSLPTQLTPPTARVEVSSTELTVGAPFVLKVHIRWAGNFDEYLLHPPELTLPEGIHQDGISASTSSGSGRNVVTYQVALRGEKAGTFELDPVELLYTPRFESAPVVSRITGPTVHLSRGPLEGLAGSTPGLLAASAAVALLVGLTMVVVRRRRGRRNPVAGTETMSRYDELHRALDSARKARFEGEVPRFLGILQTLDMSLREGSSDELEPEVERLKEWIEGVSYGGQVLPREELDRLDRWIERRIEARRPDEREAVRQKIQLAPER